MLEEYRENKVVVNSEDIVQWVAECNVKPRPEELYPNDDSLHEKQPNLYSTTIKNQVKPVLTQGATSTYAALQTIACHTKGHQCAVLREG